MRFKLFCIHVLLFILCVITFDLGAGGGSVPKLVFTSWQPGQSPLVTGPYIQGTTTEKQLSFLTNEETKCKLVVNVGYADDNPANAYQLNSYEFKIDAKVLLPGLSEEEQKMHTFTFPQKGKQNVAAGATSFSYSDEGTLTEHWGPSTRKRNHCSNYAHKSKYNPQETQQKGRKLAIDVTFIGYYGTDPNNEQKREIKLPLDQFEIDQMRQEYLDHIMTARVTKPKTYQKYGDMSVPARSDFSVADGYSDAHAHTFMINRNLAAKHQHWTQACDKYVGEVLRKEHRIKSLRKTGAYRNSHHHVYHVTEGPGSKTSFLSQHQYGRALDVETVDMNGNNKLENGYNGVDGNLMEEAAKNYAGASWTSNEYTDGHVHAQWSWGDSTSSERVSQVPEEQQNNPTPPTPTQSTPPSTITYACGVHSGDASLSSSHTLQASCSETDSYGQGCTVTSFYACQTHTHQYPDLVSGACGHTYTSGNASSHSLQASCLVTNANGDSCTVTGFYACASPHTHQYPAPTATCANGHTYNPTITSAKNNHRTRTCRFAECGQTWERCVSPTPICNKPYRKRNGLRCWKIE